MKIEIRCFKFKIQNGPIVDLTPNIIEKIIPYLQNNINENEAGGCLTGYQNKYTGNITINDLSLPGVNDIRTTVFCKLKDKVHKVFLRNQNIKKNYYMGSWHTHPQKAPIPSSIDFGDWNMALIKDKTGCQFAFFIIFGNKEFKIWYGDFSTKKIFELNEMRRIDDLYIKE
ncbi:MAG: Mov34/MPN/PAD-1 family protein [Ruminococcus sp.]|nr:Mov34/MPN/PAD-1 family protein [Ruminococcus sp.]